MLFLDNDDDDSSDIIAINLSSISSSSDSSDNSDSSSRSLVDGLRERGWAIAVVDVTDSKEGQALTSFTSIFDQAFGLPNEAKDAFRFTNKRGLNIGYRRDDDKEFFETRVDNEGGIYPYFDVDNTNGYQQTVLSLYSSLSKIGTLVLSSIATDLNIDRRAFLELTDINPSYSDDVTLLPHVDADEYSSSLLRICRYPQDSDDGSSKVMFGAHTDTSFITIGPVTSNNVPGLELMEFKSNISNNDNNTSSRWIAVESKAKAILSSRGNPNEVAVVIFVGELLHLLTKGLFKAVVHRVVNTNANTNTTTNSSVITSIPRISCPFIIRGRLKKVIIHGSLAGVNMKTLNTMIDFKRDKKAKENKDTDTEWILSSFPIDY